MIISSRKRFIFAAFNKTATTSIERVLQPYNSALLFYFLRWRYEREIDSNVIFKHARPRDLKQLLGGAAWNRNFKFTFVRNPWSRAVSLYNFHRREPTRRRRELAMKSFEAWVRGGGTGTAHKSMTEFISDDNGKVIVDFVGKYENLNADFKTVCEQIGLPELDLPHLNQSIRGNYRQLYTRETRDIVASWCAKDIDTFGYEF
jgi:hypothetical protein